MFRGIWTKMSGEDLLKNSIPFQDVEDTSFFDSL